MTCIASQRYTVMTSLVCSFRKLRLDYVSSNRPWHEHWAAAGRLLIHSIQDWCAMCTVWERPLCRRQLRRRSPLYLYNLLHRLQIALSRIQCDGWLTCVNPLTEYKVTATLPVRRQSVLYRPCISWKFTRSPANTSLHSQLTWVSLEFYNSDFSFHFIYLFPAYKNVT